MLRSNPFDVVVQWVAAVGGVRWAEFDGVVVEAVADGDPVVGEAEADRDHIAGGVGLAAAPHQKFHGVELLTV